MGLWPGGSRRLLLGLACCALAAACDRLELDFARGAGSFCEEDAACDEGLYCDPAEARCKMLDAIGARCDANNQCESGLCVRGLCCDGPCNAECLTCSLPGAEGRCTVVPEGDDPHDHCPGTAQCGALGRCQGSVEWARALGDTADQRVVAVAAVADGVVVAGTFGGTVLVGGEEWKASSPEPDLFVARFDAAGTLAWGRTFAGDGAVEVAGIATDPAGRTYVAGTHRGSLTTALGALGAEEEDGYVIALAPDGGVIWARSIGGAREQRIADIASTESRLVVVGRHRGAFVVDDFGTLGGLSIDAFVLALAFDGTPVSFGSYGGDLLQETRAVAARTGSEAVVAIVGSGEVDFGAGALVGSLGDRDLYLAKLDLSHDSPALVWDLHLGGAGSDQVATDLVLDAGGNAWLAATTSGPVAGLAVQHVEGLDGFVTRLDAVSGAPSAPRSLVGPFDDIPRSIAVAKGGEVVVAGSFEVSLSLGEEGALEGFGSRDIFVLELDPAGDLAWATPYGGPLSDVIEDLALDPLGDVYGVGAFEHRLILGAELLEAHGGEDGLICRLTR